MTITFLCVLFPEGCIRKISGMLLLKVSDACVDGQAQCDLLISYWLVLPPYNQIDCYAFVQCISDLTSRHDLCGCYMKMSTDV